MSKLKSILFALAFMFVGAPSTASTPAVNGASLIVADASMSSTERRVRDAAVRVFTHGGGHGSGSYIKHKDFLFILTAQHVADGPLYSDYRVKKGNETKTAVLVWSLHPWITKQLLTFPRLELKSAILATLLVTS
jgi:hypothetical protein